MAQEHSSSIIDAERHLTLSNGRKFQTTSNAYPLPIDSDEHSRLDLQHEVLRLMLDGKLYQNPELVEAALSPQDNTKRRVLDVGAGSGIWAIEMAEKFPHAEILGIDLVEPNILSDPARRVPPNCSFQIADANKDMGQIDSVYDLVHFRCVEAGIYDADLFFYDAARVLRPGGLLLLAGANIQLVDENGKYVPLQPPGTAGYSHYQHLVSCAAEVHLKAGPFRLRHPFWKNILESNPNYSNIQIREFLIPTGPWSNDLNATERKLAEAMQANVLRLFPAFKAMLLRDKSLPEDFVNSLAEGLLKEIRELPTVVHKYSKWVFITAVRNDMPWAAREKPWQEPPGYDIYDYIVRPLPKE